MPYLNTSSGLSQPWSVQPLMPQQGQALSPQPQFPPGQMGAAQVGGGMLGRLIASGLGQQQPGAPMQLQGAVPPSPQPQQFGPAMPPQGMASQPQQGGVLSRLIGSTLGGAPQGQQQGAGQPLGGTRFVNGLNVAG